MHQRVPMPLAKVGPHLLIQRVVLQQLIQLFEHRVDALGHLRHPRKHVFCLIVVDKHLAFLLHVVLARFLLSFYTLLALTRLHRLISHRKLVLDTFDADALEKEKRFSSYRNTLLGTFRAVILGNPGGGKSTLAHKLCYDLTTHYAERIFSGRKNITPIMVVLRDYGPEKKNHNCSILEFIQARAKADFQLRPPLGAFEYLFTNGRAMIIFDGLDELLDTRDRQEVSKAVEAFCSLYPSVPVLVTSREVGYEQAPLDEEVFEIFRLAPFSEDQVQEYASKCFDAITEIPSEQRKQKADSFLEESQMVPDLRTNPLMLALLCNIYQEEHYIPTNRPDVYEKCANMLFERWDRSRGISVNLPFDVLLRPTMTYLAYWIYAGEGLRGGVTEERLIAKTTEY